MAGVTDRPFRQLCKDLGAGMAVSEMVSANPLLRDTRKSLLRINHTGETGIRWVQIAGADPKMLAEAAVYNVEQGADIIDINMGCPAKKVCRKSAGSALLADEKLVAEICKQVVAAVDVPVTLKIRTGTDRENRNAVSIAKIAEAAGISALTIHGRTRADKFQGDAEYQTIKDVRANVSITLIANGDVSTPEIAQQVLEITGADGLMIGRAAQGRPWIFREINHFLKTGESNFTIEDAEIEEIILRHVHELHEFYGQVQGVRITRKHIGWYLAGIENSDTAKGFKQYFNKITGPKEQIIAIKGWFEKQELTKAI